MNSNKQVFIYGIKAFLSYFAFIMQHKVEKNRDEKGNKKSRLDKWIKSFSDHKKESEKK